MNKTLPDSVLRNLEVATTQGQCAEAIRFLANDPIPADIANWLSDRVERFVRDDELALDLHMRLAMASGGGPA
ncbi:hypothetical protein vB_RpoS-V16_17 [Ruegeria phage vB_RpoS-V16]|uniref:hypothetical protein n=1 Tax=Ruegeria phage vB_RpoS-V16 TaxID=2218618 RepID=UPI000DCAB4B1|nr:hypothetical protein JT311_gp17 [Ruegeria phage vB_RpoS-V16]AWY09453.1 hypothetical protein vB_RpoS-V16_17 [Ruegeria phage vB_RpoS-V16]